MARGEVGQNRLLSQTVPFLTKNHDNIVFFLFHRRHQGIRSKKYNEIKIMLQTEYYDQAC